MRYLRYILVFALMVLGLAKVGAQNDRNFIRQGNRAYHKQKWAAAETQYRKAISKNQKNAQAVYNLGCALMMQQKDSMAMIQFENASKLETNTPCAAIRRTMQPDIILPSARNCSKTRSRTSRTIRTRTTRIKTRTRTKISRIRIRTKIRIKTRTRTIKIRTISRIRTIRTR